MLDILSEMVLYEYFIYQSIIGHNDYEKKKLFSFLCDIFCVDEVNLRCLYEVAESENIKDISTADDYKRYQRIKQFILIDNDKKYYSDIEDAIIGIKGKAILTVSKFGMCAESEWTQAFTAQTVIDNAERGNIIALRVCGVLKSEGIFLKRDKKGGKQLIDNAMLWADIPSCLAMLKYSLSDRKRILSILNSAVENTPYEFIMDTVAKKYGFNDKKEYDETTLFIKKAFYSDTLTRETFDNIYARIIKSEVISLEDKKKLVLSCEKQIISEACNLPLCLQYGEIKIYKSAFDKLILQRENEKEDILSYLYCNDLRNTKTYRPLCICSSSEYTLNIYELAIKKALMSANIERIEISELKRADLEATKNNVFIRGIDEQKANVFIMSFKGDIYDDDFRFAKSFLRNENRSRFRLHYPSLSIDLSSVLPICVCDKENAKRLKDVVDIIEIQPIKKEEIVCVIKDVLSKKIANYSMKGKITFSDEVIESLTTLPIEKAETMIDKIIYLNRNKDNVINLNNENIKPFLTKDVSEEKVFGFRGTTNENTRHYD